MIDSKQMDNPLEQEQTSPTSLAPACPERLPLVMRLIASQASGLVSSSPALLFTIDPSQPSAPKLQAAAGFQSAADARQAGIDLASTAREVFTTGNQLKGPAIGGHPTGTSLFFPVSVRDQVLGALVVAVDAALPQDRLEALEALAWSAAAQIDHRRLSTEFEKLRHEWENHASIADEKSDELLKLSEELFAQDIELLRNNEKLGKIEKLKNDFIEKMSRELRTPLNSIIEATITVLAGENENLSPSSQDTLRRALDEGTAFQRTLQNILDLWRIKQDELPIEIQEFSFAEIIDETIFSVQETLGSKAVEISKELPESLPKMRGDLSKINQILFLLLDNSAKFIEQGSITIGARFMDGRLHCSIEDTGIGICADDQKYIWNEFYQVDDQASVQYRGAGLGLTLVHDLLILLEGDSLLDSEPGRGTRVEFSVPVQLA